MISWSSNLEMQQAVPIGPGVLKPSYAFS